MRIGVNARFLLTKKMEGFGWYSYETLSRITKNHPEHEFIFFFDRAYDTKFLFSENITPVVLAPQARHPILQVIWFDFSVKKALKKYKCDAFVSPDGYLSLTSDMPQLAVIHDLNFEHHPEDLPPYLLKFLRKRFPLFAQKATHICTVSQFSKDDLIQTYKIPADKISVTHNGASPVFKPIEETEKQTVRDKFTAGKPFIVFVGAIHKRKNVGRLIEAYKKLKKNPDFPFHLLLVGEPMWKSQAIQVSEADKQYIHFTGHLSLEELASIVGSAECLAFISYFEGFGIPLVEAMRAGTPVLAGNLTSLPEIGGDAVLYCDPFSIDDIQTQLEKLVSDKELQKTLTAKGLDRATQFTWDRTAEELWKGIARILPKKD